MADLKKTVEIVFGGKNEIGKVVEEIGRKFDDLDDISSKVTDPLAKVADSVIKADAALLALAIGGMAYAIKTAGEFSGKFGEISTLIKDTGAPIDQFKKDILDYSTSSVKSIGDINQAVYNAISAGVDYRNSIAFVSEAEKLSVAGRAGLDATTKVLISTLNAYGESTDKAGKYSDIMFTTVRLGQTTLEELSSSLAMVTGLASTSGISFEVLSAAIAALTVSGLPTSQAITGLRQAIQNIIKPSSEAEKTAAALGIQFNAAALKTKGFEGVLKEAYTATGGNIGKMGELFGSVESLNTVMILGADKTGKFRDAIKEMGNAAGATQVAYDKVAQEFENVNQRLANSFKVTLIVVGEQLLPEYGKIAGSLADLMKGIKVAVDAGAFDPLFAYLDQVGLDVAVWIKKVAEALPEAFGKIDFKALIAALKELRIAMADYLGQMDMTKADDLAAALQLLVDIITGLVRITTGMVDAFRPFASVVAEFFETLARGGPETQETIGKILLFAKAIQDAGLGVVATILAIDEFGISMRGLFDTVAGGTQIMWNGLEILMTAVKGMLLLVEGLFVQLLDKLTFGLFPGLTTLKEVISKQGEEINKSFAKNGDEAAAGLARLSDGLMRLGSQTGDSAEKAEKLRKRLLDLPGETSIEVKIENAQESQAKADGIAKKIESIPEKKDVGVSVTADSGSIEKVHGLIVEKFPDGSTRLTQAVVKADDASLDATKKKVETALPKEIEIQAKLDETRIKAQAETVQKAVEWKAKVDIAEVEASTKKLEAMFKSIDNTVSSTGTTLSSIIGGYADILAGGGSGSHYLELQIREENQRRDTALRMQEDLTDAQIRLMDARAKALESGQAMISVKGDGLQPHLEAFMWEILGAVQVRVNEDAGAFLLGIA